MLKSQAHSRGCYLSEWLTLDLGAGELAPEPQQIFS